MLHVYCVGAVIDVTKKVRSGVIAGYEVIGFCLYDCTTRNRKYVTRDGLKDYIETKMHSDYNENLSAYYGRLFDLYNSCKYVVFGRKKEQLIVRYFGIRLEPASKHDKRLSIDGKDLLVFDINKGYIPTGLDKVIIAKDRYYKLGLDLKDFSTFGEIEGLFENYSLFSSLRYNYKIPIFDSLGLEYKADLDGNYYVTSGDLWFFCVYGDKKVLSFDLNIRRIILNLNIEDKYSRTDGVTIIIHDQIEKLSFSCFDIGFSPVTFLVSKNCKCKLDVCRLMYGKLVEPLLEWSEHKKTKNSSLGKLARAVIDMESLYRYSDYDAMLGYKLLGLPYCEALHILSEKHSSVNVRLTRRGAAPKLSISYI